MERHRPPYLAFLLRLWATPQGDALVWRASVEHPHTGERIGFATPELLFAFLEKQIRDGDGRPYGAQADERAAE